MSGPCPPYPSKAPLFPWLAPLPATSHSLFLPACFAGEFKEATQGIGPIKGMSFSSDGRFLALGGEDGAIEVLEWPSMKRKLRCASAGAACILAGVGGRPGAEGDARQRHRSGPA